MRECPMCKSEKPLSEFPKKPRGPFSWMCRMCERNRASIRKHALTIPQKDEIAAHQGGCRICGHSEPSSRGWVVDHDHECCSGEKSCPKCRRGIVCSWCNTMLANAFDRIEILQSAITYLQDHANRTCDWHMPLACAPALCGRQMHEQNGRTHEESFLTFRDESYVGNARKPIRESLKFGGPVGTTSSSKEAVR